MRRAGLRRFFAGILLGVYRVYGRFCCRLRQEWTCRGKYCVVIMSIARLLARLVFVWKRRVIGRMKACMRSFPCLFLWWIRTRRARCWGICAGTTTPARTLISFLLDISERGSHEELLHREGVYEDLYREQLLERECGVGVEGLSMQAVARGMDGKRLPQIDLIA